MKPCEPTRPDPEELLRQVQAQEACDSRGRLKIFLGYAPQVGKSVRMLDEGRRRKKRGQDVVIGAIQAKGSQEVAGLIQQMEVIPMKRVDDFDVVELLTLLTDRCVEVLDISAAGLMLVAPDGDLRVMASSSERIILIHADSLRRSVR